MRKYQRSRVGIFKDPAVRKEIERLDRWAEQMSAAVSRLAQTNYPDPTDPGRPGGPNPPSSLPDHDHSAPGLGGDILGLSGTKVMDARGVWYHDGKIGIKNIAPAGRLHIGKSAPDAYVYSRPSGTVVTGNFLRQPAGDANLHLALDEVVPDDADYISPSILSPTTCTLNMSTVTDPGTDQDWLIRVRAWDTGLGAGSSFNMTLTLLVGVSTIQTWIVPITNAATTYSLYVDAAKAALISDFTNLRISWGSGTSFGSTHRCSWLELRFPNPAGLPDLGVLAILQACASQTSDLLQVRDNSSAVKAVITAGARVGIGTDTPNTPLHVKLLADETGLTLQAHASQTQDIFQIVDSAGFSMLEVASNGSLGIGISADINTALRVSRLITATASQRLSYFYGEITDNTGGLWHAGLYSKLVLKGSGDQSLYEHFGSEFVIDYQGTYAGTPAYAITAAVFKAIHSATGPVDYLTGLGLYGDVSGSGQVVQYSGLYIANPNTTVDTDLLSQYGIYIEGLTAALVNWGIYCPNKCLFGQTGIGVSPTAMFDVTADGNSRIGLRVSGTAAATANLAEFRRGTTNKTIIDSQGRLQTLVNAATAPVFQDYTTTSKTLGFNLSGMSASVNALIAIVATAARTYTFPNHSGTVVLREGSYEATGLATLPSQNLVTSTPIAGNYRVSVYGKTTTAKAGASLDLTIAWNDGTAQTKVYTTFLDLATANAYGSADFFLYAGSATAISISGTVVSGDGTERFSIYAKCEAI